MTVFKKCDCCGVSWKSRDDFINTPDLKPLGFQAHFSDGLKSMLLFQHLKNDCLTTLALPLKEFLDLIHGYMDLENALGSELCEGHCLNYDFAAVCKNQNCRNALVRNFIRELVKDGGFKTTP